MIYARTISVPNLLIRSSCALFSSVSTVTSGTTAVTALNTGCRFVCFETAPAFYAVASECIHTARAAVESGQYGV